MGRQLLQRLLTGLCTLNGTKMPTVRNNITSGTVWRTTSVAPPRRRSLSASWTRSTLAMPSALVLVNTHNADVLLHGPDHPYITAINDSVLLTGELRHDELHLLGTPTARLSTSTRCGPTTAAVGRRR